MITRVLVANRGEIAVRVIRACHRLGRQAVVVHSDPDEGSMAVELADAVVALAGSTAAETYLDIGRVVSAAVASGCDAVHPGYGFLAEQADFARAVAASSLTWIGPPADVIALMGDKLSARQIAVDAGVPIVPGATVAVDDADEVLKLGESLGWPLTVKAVHGGGGRGMRVISGPGELADSLAAARRESQSSFGRPELYVERFLERPRHVEVQIVADHHGGLVVVGDRDCSIQRRYQKLIEEAPAPNLPDSLRAALADAAERLARAVGYTNAGTVEFLVEDNELYFLEMNTRIQVEHPVTELVSGIDIVAEQILIADDRVLSFGPADVRPRGAAIEVRINAEDPAAGRFLPTPGTLVRFQLPSGPGVRVDTGLRAGDELTPHYDNLVAKIAVLGDDREDARLRTLQALRELIVEGVSTTAPAVAAVLAHDDFRDVSHSTRWLLDHAAELLPLPPPVEDVTVDAPVPSTAPFSGPAAEVEVLGRWYRIPRFTDGFADSATDGDDSGDGAVATTVGPPRDRVASTAPPRSGSGRVIAPMQGTLRTVDVEVGDAVTADTKVAVLEAMKMENPLFAGVDGVVVAVHVTAGANVAPGALLVEVEPR